MFLYLEGPSSSVVEHWRSYLKLLLNLEGIKFINEDLKQVSRADCLPDEVNKYPLDEFIKLYKVKVLKNNQEALESPLLPNLHFELHTKALEVFKIVQILCNERISFEKLKIYGSKVVEEGIREKALRDEILLQIINLLSLNGGNVVQLRLVLGGCLACFRPSSHFFPYLLNFISKEDNLKESFCQSNLLQNFFFSFDKMAPTVTSLEERAFPPCLLEWCAFALNANMCLPFLSPDGRTHHERTNSWMTSEQFACNALIHNLKVPANHSKGWAVSLRMNGKSFENMGHECLLDVISQLESYQDSHKVATEPASHETFTSLYDTFRGSLNDMKFTETILDEIFNEHKSEIESVEAVVRRIKGGGRQFENSKSEEKNKKIEQNQNELERNLLEKQLLEISLENETLKLKLKQMQDEQVTYRRQAAPPNSLSPTSNSKDYKPKIQPTYNVEKEIKSRDNRKGGKFIFRANETIASNFGTPAPKVTRNSAPITSLPTLNFSQKHAHTVPNPVLYEEKQTKKLQNAEMFRAASPALASHKEQLETLKTTKTSRAGSPLATSSPQKNQDQVSNIDLQKNTKSQMKSSGSFILNTPNRNADIGSVKPSPTSSVTRINKSCEKKVEEEVDNQKETMSMGGRKEFMNKLEEIYASYNCKMNKSHSCSKAKSFPESSKEMLIKPSKKTFAKLDLTLTPPNVPSDTQKHNLSPLTPPTITYEHPAWELQIRKEFFYPRESLTSKLCIDILFKQIYNDICDAECLRLSDDCKRKMQRAFDVYKKNKNTKENRLKLIEKAKSLHLYFSKVFVVKNMDDGKANFLAIASNTLSLLYKTVFSTQKLNSHFITPYCQVTVVAAGSNKLIIKLQHESFLIHTPNAVLISTLVGDYTKASEPTKN